MCAFYYREDGTLTPEQLFSYLTVDGIVPNSDDIMKEIEKLGMHHENGVINLNEFKKIIWHFKSILNKQLDFRERIENILKIKVEGHNLFELKYIFKDFYESIMEYIYGKEDDKKSHLLVKDLIQVVTLGF